MYATLKMARDALEAAADKMLEDYRTWVADDVTAKPRYGQIPAYDAVNAAVRECEDALRAAPTVAAQQCGLDEKALEAARRAFANGEKFSDQLPSAIRAYLSTAAPPDVAGLIAELADENFRHEMQHLRSSAEIDRLFQQAATALRLSAGGGWGEPVAFARPQAIEHLRSTTTPGFEGLQTFLRVEQSRHNTVPLYTLPASPTVEAGHVE